MFTVRGTKKLFCPYWSQPVRQGLLACGTAADHRLSPLPERASTSLARTAPYRRVGDTADARSRFRPIV